LFKEPFKDVFENFELCEFVLFIFAKLENAVVFLFIMENTVCIYVGFGDWLEIASSHCHDPTTYDNS
jgi:hypothetical protein